LQGFWVVIFPEGTRVKPGTRRKYQPGGAWLATQTGVPVVPVAHNAGLYWGKNAFLKYPGTITMRIGPAIPTLGRDPAEVNAEAETWIERQQEDICPAHSN
jgi:1-acyl-sn-glycerol-3-phosphate acyltransferase